MASRKDAIQASGIDKAPKEVQAFQPFRGGSGSGGVGPGVVTILRDQPRMNHLAGLKAKDIDTTNTEPAFLLGGWNVQMLWDRLAESSLRSNAVSSSVMDRKKTQGAASQTTRISCKAIGQAAAAQVVSVALASAEARRAMRCNGMATTNAIATTAVNPCTLAFCDVDGIPEGRVFCVTSTSRLVYNANQVRLTSSCLLSVAVELAREELQWYAISNAMGTRSRALLNICSSLAQGGSLDSVWCAWALVVYLSSHPRGRDLLRATQLTDLDVQSAVAFERYGGEEVRRRERQQRATDAGRRCHDAASSSNAPSSAVHPHCPHTASDGCSIVEFWNRALQSPNVSVLHTLAAHSKSTARNAALSTLARQADNTTIASNSILQNVSLTNAVKSAQALVSFVGRRAEDAPAVLAIGWQDGAEKRVAFGISRVSKEAASSALHACTLMHASVRPSADVGIMVAWSFAVQKLLPRDEQSATLPGVLERHAKAESLKAAAERGGGRRSATLSRRIGMLMAFVDSESEAALPQQASGTTRSFLSFECTMRMHPSQFRSAEGLLREAVALRDALPEWRATGGAPRLVASSRNSAERTEPFCNPATPLAVGICTNEAIRRWLAGKTRKNDPCRKQLGFVSSAELARDVPCVLDSEPVPLLTITDFGIERIGDPPSGNDGLAQVALSLHVCGDGASRVPECLFAVQQKLAEEDPVAALRQCRAGLFVAASQSSYIGSVGSSLSAGYTNASVASSKKISISDVNKLMLLTPFDCYVAGLCNLQSSFEGTAYVGTYGCRVDTGFTPPGLFAHNFKSDRRQHGNCCLSEEAADRMAPAFGRSHWVVFQAQTADGDAGKTYYTEAPPATRGIPHGFVPGVHSVLDEYCDFVESCRACTGRDLCDTVDSVLALPFGPFSQSLAPDIDSTADPSMRTCFRERGASSVATGRAYMPDNTSEEDALVREPLFRRPCQVSGGDCPFATSYEAVDTFFNAASTLALLAQLAAQRPADAESALRHTHECISRFVDCDDELDAVSAAWAADALVLLSVLYPSNTAVGEDALLDAIAAFPAACQTALGRASTFSAADASVDGADLRAAVVFWNAFRRGGSACAWEAGIAPLLRLVIDKGGSHSVSADDIVAFRSALETAVRAVWLVFSEDGHHPPVGHPASSASSPCNVMRHHIDPVFVGSERDGLVQRGSSVGLKPHSYRQVLAELLGASIEGSNCNVTINEGGLALRVSSDSTILDEKGNERTEKSISPVQTEGDEAAYGTRDDKMRGAVLQKRAWDANALRCAPLYTAIAPPRPAELRSRGEFGFSRFFLDENAQMHMDGQRATASFEHAKRAIVASSDPTTAKYVNSLVS